MVHFAKLILFAGALVLVGGISCAQSFVREKGYPSLNIKSTLSPMKPHFRSSQKNWIHFSVHLEEIVDGLVEPTDIQFIPGSSTQMIVLEKRGRLRWLDLSTEKERILLQLNVLAHSELGLLGAAFHPNYQDNGKLYLHYSTRFKQKTISRISEWHISSPKHVFQSKVTKERIILEVVQPYSNHNAGALAFGQDGMLYIGWGDGGWAGDPHAHGQNPQTWLGSILRIDINKREQGKPYGIPHDNPFFQSKTVLPEIWALGFRNPWKFSFSPKGQLIVADVGQNKWEEINIVVSGENYGWNIREGRHCYAPPLFCKSAHLTDPVFEYNHREGQSITGGFVYHGKIKPLQGKYIFGDYESGQIWAIVLPKDHKGTVKTVFSLGHWPITITTFGQDHQGELYIGDFTEGRIYRIVP